MQKLQPIFGEWQLEMFSVYTLSIFTENVDMAEYLGFLCSFAVLAGSDVCCWKRFLCIIKHHFLSTET